MQKLFTPNRNAFIAALGRLFSKPNAKAAAIMLLLATAPALQAQVTASWQHERIFDLGEIVVSGQRLRDTFSLLSIERIEQFNRLDASQALNLLPGVTLANVGPRNESVVYVRGFDLRQVPVFIDGIPVYIPYDGYVDLARFTTADLSKIQVDKGYSSILYGPNTMGGAINLVSRRPLSPLEFDGRVGWMSGQGSRANLNLGSRLGQFYLQGGFSYLNRETYPLSKRFEPVASEDGGERENAFRRDSKLSLKAGFTPNAQDEYAIGYVRQDGRKGNPLYTGDDPNIRVRYWQWPDWDKESLYFLSNTSIGQSSQLKVRLYYDQFKNALFSYDDATFTTQERPFAFQSFYDDYAYGGNAEFSTRLMPGNELKAAVYFKHDTHRENNLGEPQRTMADNTISFALEDHLEFGEKWRLVPGVSYNVRTSLEAQDFLAGEGKIVDFPINDNSALNLQAGLWYQPAESHSLRASVARKTRFATMKDRYSYRLGMALPNPDLEAEAATHYELAYVGRLAAEERLALQFNAFYTDIANAIQQVDGVQGDLFQLQNTGAARFVGLETGLDWQLAAQLRVGANYSFIRQENISQPEVRFINVPEHKVFAYADARVAKRLSLLASAEYNSERYSTSYGTTAAAFTVVNLNTRFSIMPWLALEGGVNNIFDANYQLVEGFPEEGRNFFLTLAFKRQ